MRKHSAFTLVELIVVITILAILGTIAFLSFNNYSSSARDSTRVADINGMMKSLETFQIATNSYPAPDNSFAVTYSGGVIWNQGTFGSGVFTKLSNTKGINKAPLDPLKNTEYTYSSLAFGRGYQIKADYEGDSTAYLSPLSPVDTAYAASGNPTIAYIKGTYPGIVAKTQAGSSPVYTYVLAIPSIITSHSATAGSTVTIESNVISGKLLFNNKSTVTAPSTFNPNTVVFAGTTLPKDDTSSAITTMMTAIKTAYNASDLTSDPTISSFLNTPSGQIASVGASIIKSQLGGNASASISSSPVSGACSGIPGNAIYFNNSPTTYSISNAPAGTSLTASYSATPVTNTCQFKCGAGAYWTGTVCSLLYHGWTSPLSGCSTTSYDTTSPTALGGLYPYNASDSLACKAWKLAATVCTTEPTQYSDSNNYQCPNSGGFTDPVFGAYCAVSNQFSCSTCPGNCNAQCSYNPLSLRNCSGLETINN